MITATLREDWEQALRDIPTAFQIQYHRRCSLVLMGESVYSYYYVKLFQHFETLREQGLCRDCYDDKSKPEIVKALDCENHFEYCGVVYIECRDLHPMQIARV